MMDQRHHLNAYHAIDISQTSCVINNTLRLGMEEKQLILLILQPETNKFIRNIGIVILEQMLISLIRLTKLEMIMVSILIMMK